MKTNENTRIVSKTVILVPYKDFHVDKYHKWMENDELRRLTASDRLSLEDECKMQQTWLNDEKKCTFIVLHRETWTETKDEICSMIGDVNLYLDSDGSTAEIGLMVAETNLRRQGLGKEITLCMLRYAVERLRVQKFKAIISEDNTPCLQLFYRLNFGKESESNVFKEITLGKEVNSDFIDFIKEETPQYQEEVGDLHEFAS